MDASTLIYQSKRALDGDHPRHGFLIKDGPEQASAHALVALAEQQQETNRYLASIAESLATLADASTNRPSAPATDPEPKRRLWLLTRRKTA
ncbi:hypothetical protein [Streptomyces rubiginosohelvolus]|uniref:hypothetical protein n=1 Tax=Streptomyces rubiginosohelvolus TaxID=67362 RepID=UPI0036AB6773